MTCLATDICGKEETLLFISGANRLSYQTLRIVV